MTNPRIFSSLFVAFVLMMSLNAFALEAPLAPASAAPIEISEPQATLPLPVEDHGLARLSLRPVDPKDVGGYDTLPRTIGPVSVQNDQQKKNNKLALKLLGAGLLLLPFDKGLSDSMVRDDGQAHDDDVTGMFNSLGTKEFLLGAMGGLYLLGDEDEKDTAKLALTALVNSAITTETIKRLTGRERPNGLLDPGRFNGPGSDHKSFPSGHTSAAFSVATVLAKKDPKQKWLYYGLATAVGISRMRSSAHFPSDVLAGAAIGIYQGNNAVSLGPNILTFKFRF